MNRDVKLTPARPRLAAGLNVGLLIIALAATASAQGYRVINLVSDVPGVARNEDTNLVNAWGLEIGHDGNLIVSATETSQARFYEADGTPKEFSIAVEEEPTGVVINRFPRHFPIGEGAAARPSQLIFVTEEGTILGWNPHVERDEAVVAVDNSASEAVYKGVAQAWTRHGPRLYAANFRGGRVEVYDGAFHSVGAFTDPGVDPGFSPFDIANIGGLLYVTFAKPALPDMEDDEPGPGNGFVDIFTPDGHLLRRLISHGPLNSPWGLALAPRHFGRLGGALLVGNFGDGKINAFHPWTGAFLGSLNGEDGAPIQIPGLWALKFGNGSDREDDHSFGDDDDDGPVLYFTAGPANESHGLVGVIIPPNRF